jgi:trans-aconitate 2-methyltransferase
MLERAKPLQHERQQFEQGLIEDIRGEFDLVFSHAALQWVEDHASLIPAVWRLVAPGGQLAVQVPSNHGHVSHVLMAETARDPEFNAEFDGWSRVSPVLPIDQYARLLYDCGAARINVVEKVYTHVLDDAAAVVEWVRGTALRPYLARVSGQQRDLFVERYRSRLQAALPGSPVLYPFRRTLFCAVRPESGR